MQFVNDTEFDRLGAFYLFCGGNIRRPQRSRIRLMRK